jgi:hypothetical protein
LAAGWKSGCCGGVAIMKNYSWFCGIVISLGLFLFFSCDNPADDNSAVLYPYTEHGIEYLGLKPGLTVSSSDQEFDTGLNEVLQAYLKDHPNSSNDFSFDGVTYELTNLQAITGGVPNFVWDSYWKDIDEYSYSIGSCWGFIYGEIPSKGGTGTAYALYTIVTYASTYGNSEVRYMAGKGNVSPKI